MVQSKAITANTPHFASSPCCSHKHANAQTRICKYSCHTCCHISNTDTTTWALHRKRPSAQAMTLRTHIAQVRQSVLQKGLNIRQKIKRICFFFCRPCTPRIFHGVTFGPRNFNLCSMLAFLLCGQRNWIQNFACNKPQTNFFSSHKKLGNVGQPLPMQCSHTPEKPYTHGNNKRAHTHPLALCKTHSRNCLQRMFHKAINDKHNPNANSPVGLATPRSGLTPASVLFTIESCQRNLQDKPYKFHLLFKFIRNILSRLPHSAPRHPLAPSQANTCNSNYLQLHLIYTAPNFSSNLLRRCFLSKRNRKQNNPVATY